MGKKHKKKRSGLLSMNELRDITAQAEVTIGDESLDFRLPVKEFSSGSRGFWAQRRIHHDANNKFLVQVTVVLVGSKDE